MALRAKPTQQVVLEEEKINAILEKGGSVADTTLTSNGKKTTNYQLRLPRNLASQIDRKCEKRIVPPSRHAWILEAIFEKLKAEK